jgi:4-carboxymuconolactone decarboxylase
LSLVGSLPQLTGRIQGNVNVGSDKAFLLAGVTQLLPFIGYPRALGGHRLLEEGSRRKQQPRKASGLGAKAVSNW